MTLSLKQLLADRQGENYSLHDRFINPTFAKVLKIIGFDRTYERGQGAYLYDTEGKAYLDCVSGIAVSGIVHPASAILALFGMLIASYTRAAAESIGNLPTCAVGWMGRLEKLAIIMLGSLLEKYYPGYNILDYALIIVGITSIITSIQRLLFAKKALKDRQS